MDPAPPSIMLATGSKKFVANRPANRTHRNVNPAPKTPSLATHQVVMAMIPRRIRLKITSMVSHRLQATTGLTQRRKDAKSSLPPSSRLLCVFATLRDDLSFPWVPVEDRAWQSAVHSHFTLT